MRGGVQEIIIVSAHAQHAEVFLKLCGGINSISPAAGYCGNSVLSAPRQPADKPGFCPGGVVNI